MKKTLNITIGGRVFAIEEDAYEKLNLYLETVKKTFAAYPDPEEIIADMEDRLAEQFQSMHEKDGTQFITRQNVETVIAIMGTPEDIEQETEKEDSTSSFSTKKDEPRSDGPRRLYRNPDDKVIFGVCSGIAAYFGIDTIWVRIGFIILTLLWGTGILMYIILALIIPEAKTTTEKMAMRGQPITIAGIVDTMKQEFTEEKNKERIEKIKHLTTDASDSIHNVFEKQGPKLESTFKRIIRFPFEIIINVLRFITNKIFPIIIRIGGVFVILGSLAAVFSLVSGLFFILFNRNTSYFHWPFTELFDPTSYYLILLSLFIVVVIPTILVFLLGITMIRYKNSFNRAFTLCLIGTWIVIGIVGGATVAAKMPEVIQRIPENEYFKDVTEEYPLTDFDTIVSSGYRFQTIIHQGTHYQVMVKGKKPYFKELKIEKSDTHTLHIAELNPQFGCLGWCNDSYDLTVEITLPELHQLTTTDSRPLTLTSRQEKNITIDANKFSLIKITDLTAQNLTMNIKEGGRITMTGKVTNADMHIDQGFFWGENLLAKTMKLDLGIYSEARVNVANELRVSAEHDSTIVYRGTPKIISTLGENATLETYDHYLAHEADRQRENQVFSPDESPDTPSSSTADFPQE